MIQIHPLKRKKRKEVEEDPNLVAYGRFQMFGGQWKEKEKHPFHLSSHFAPNKIYLNVFFH